MSEVTQVVPQAQSAYFDLHVEGVGYLNRVRSVKPKNGTEFWACTIAAIRGASDAVNYTKFDCRVSGAEAQRIVRSLESAVQAEKSVIIGFKLGDIYPDLFTYEKGERKGSAGVSIKGRLLKIRFAKVDGVPVEFSQQAELDVAA